VQSGEFKQQNTFSSEEFLRSEVAVILAARKDVTYIRGRVTVPTPALSWWEAFKRSFLKTPGLFPQGS